MCFALSFGSLSCLVRLGDDEGDNVIFMTEMALDFGPLSIAERLILVFGLNLTDEHILPGL
jgi:hypothetical protein